MTSPFAVRPLSRAEYMAHLRDLLLALVARHGQLTVRAAHELVNEAIAKHGIDSAAAQVRRGA